ncbi:MAG: Lrp/AsnC ligand binding domain-containing protein [Thaumarchaeota archaeon]|nr:Lrp/AsnC ligand binding domain-containing protein [Nitrososphaerota archaeon]
MKKTYILASCQIGSEIPVLNELEKISDVKEAHGILGAYDIVIEVESKSPEELNNTIAKIRQIPKLMSTLTLMKIEGQGFSK